MSVGAPRPHPVEVIRQQLDEVLRAGIRPAALARCSAALALLPDGPVDPYERALIVRALLLRALDGLGEGDIAEAAQLLFGNHPDSSGRLLKDRRRLAATHLGLTPSYFRRRGGLEDQILDDLAVNIWHDLLTRLQGGD